MAYPSRLSRPVIRKAFDFLLPRDAGPGCGQIVGVGSVESAFLIQTAPCLSDYKHADVPAIMAYIQYLTQLEGPMWRQIRGLGLSYHYRSVHSWGTDTRPRTVLPLQVSTQLGGRYAA